MRIIYDLKIEQDTILRAIADLLYFKPDEKINSLNIREEIFRRVKYDGINGLEFPGDEFDDLEFRHQCEEKAQLYFERYKDKIK
jgi:hypothetical protein